MSFAQLLATGAALPKHCVSNEALCGRVKTTPEWIVARSGIEQRYLAQGESTGDLAYEAAHQALQQAGIQQVQLLIVATTTPDHVLPSVASECQHRLGLNHCTAFDLQAVCSGFVYALQVADQFIRAGSVQSALVIGAEVCSRLLNWQDPASCVLFGDGAGAVVLQASDQPGIEASLTGADGRYQSILWVPGLDSPLASTLHMEGQEVFRVAIRSMAASINTLLTQQQLTMDDIDWLIPHQANQRLLTALAKRLGLPSTKVVSTIAQHGNTSAASIPLALHHASEQGLLQPGQRILFCGFGAGATWGANLLRLPNQ